MEKICVVAANCSINAVCLMIKWMWVFLFPHQQVSGDGKVKGNNMPGNNAPHGNVAQQCSVCARVCTVSSLSSTTVAQEENRPAWLSVRADAYSLLWLFLPGGGAAGFTLPEFWTCAVNGKCSGNGCDTGLCRFTSWFRFLWHTQALRGSGKKDWYHLPSSFPHELPHV